MQWRSDHRVSARGVGSGQQGSFRSGSLKAIQSKEDWVLWASKALGTKRSLKRRADSIRLSADGVVPLDLACPSSREALLGPAGTAYANSGIVVATDGSLRGDGSMGAALVAKDGRLPARGVAVFGQPSSLRPELTGIALDWRTVQGRKTSMSSLTASAP